MTNNDTAPSRSQSNNDTTPSRSQANNYTAPSRSQGNNDTAPNRSQAKSAEWFSRAEQLMPGGVNSPVRAFRYVGGKPLFIERADGSRIYDVDGNSYIDYVSSWGPMILGHNNRLIREAVVQAAGQGLSYGAPTAAEVALAEKIIAFNPSIEMVRMVNSGTEAVMSALRLARAYTERDKVIKFAGCYHGHVDSMLVKAGSGAMTSGEPDSLGVTKALAEDTLIAAYNNLDEVELLLKNLQVAAIIVEPVAANMGLVLPEPGFLEGLRALADQYAALLVFDEVITGFRLAKGGAQEYFGINADIVTYGKIIGGGLPVGAYGGRREIMQMVSPSGGVYQAGTLSGNPIAMAAGLAQLEQLEDQGVYEQISRLGQRLAQGLSDICISLGLPCCVTNIGSLATLFFGVGSAKDYATVSRADTGQYASYFLKSLDAGVYLAPSQFEAMFVSAAHSDDDIDETLNVAEDALKQLSGR